jgi:glycosyltransferase involved in cell wall biosynthesis
MNIGIDCRIITERAGIGEYTRQLVKNLIEANQSDKLVLFFGDKKSAEGFASEKVKLRVFPLFRLRKFLPLIYSQIIVPVYLAQENCAVMLFPANVAPLFYFKKFVVVIHDLAVYKFPELFPNSILAFDRRILVPWSLYRAERIIAVSKSTKDDIIELFKVVAAKITVAYEGGDFKYIKNKVTVLPGGFAGKRYFLFIGTIEPRKNLVRLIEGYKKLVQSGIDEFELVLAGKSGWKNKAVFETITKTNQELGSERVKYCGFVSVEEKAALYRNAFALVLPSIYEGFGLPAAEALHFGLPLILANNSALPEIGGSAAIYFETESVDSIFEALKKLSGESEIHAQLVALAFSRAGKFTWRNCAENVLDILKSA